MRGVLNSAIGSTESFAVPNRSLVSVVCPNFPSARSTTRTRAVSSRRSSTSSPLRTSRRALRLPMKPGRRLSPRQWEASPLGVLPNAILAIVETRPKLDLEVAAELSWMLPCTVDARWVLLFADARSREPRRLTALRRRRKRLALARPTTKSITPTTERVAGTATLLRKGGLGGARSMDNPGDDSGHGDVKGGGGAHGGIAPPWPL